MYNLTFILYFIISQKGTCAGFFFKKKLDGNKLKELEARYDNAQKSDSRRLEETDENNNNCKCENNLS